jgi:nitroimidazol reductase NimA-like FMN-containing flavoprotein (pyridoxamine 5'-phosphate oxidase superfamily)
MSILGSQTEKHLRSENNIWVATTRPDGRPHLTPTWFVLVDGKIYICIDPASVKARNLESNDQVALALEDGSSPVIVEGAGRPIDGSDRPQGVLDEFKRKYDWDVATDSQYGLLIEIAPKKVLSWNSGG